MDEQLIKLKTDHTSDAVRSYKRVSDEQLSGMTDVISSKCLKEAVSNVSRNDIKFSLPESSMNIVLVVYSPTATLQAV